MYGGDYSSYFDSMGAMYESMDVWDELLPGEDGQLIAQQEKEGYDLLYGKWPESYDEVILFVDENNEVSDLMLYALGLMSHDEMTETLTALQNGESVDMSTMLTSLMGAQHEGENHALDQVYTSTVMYDLMDSMLNAETVTNNLRDFKTWLDEGGGGITDLATVRYGYNFQFDIYN